MGQENLIYKCGHSEIVQLYGKHTDRDYKVAQAKKEDCIDCRADQLNSDLVGSNKQIVWAHDIRKAYMAEVEKIRTAYEASCQNPKASISSDKLDLAKRAMTALLRACECKTAKYWIDGRNMGPRGFLDEFVRAEAKQKKETL